MFKVYESEAPQKSRRGKYSRKTSNNSTNTQDSDSQTFFHSSRNHVAHQQKKKNLPKFKTQLCKTYSEKGNCPYRWKCQFAHGPEELHIDQPTTNRNFRTKKCRSFWQQGFCPYGVRCQFDHSQEISEQTVNYLKIWKLILETKQEGQRSKLFLQKDSSLPPQSQFNDSIYL